MATLKIRSAYMCIPMGCIELGLGKAALLWRPQAGRSEPFAHVSADLSLPSPAYGLVAYRSMGERFGFFAETPRFFGKTFFKGKSLFETAAFRHDATSSFKFTGPNRRA